MSGSPKTSGYFWKDLSAPVDDLPTQIQRQEREQLGGIFPNTPPSEWATRDIPPAALKLSVLAAPVAPQVEVAHVAVDFPPGFAGDIARWLCDSVALSVREAGIGGALGLLAGVLGGAFTVGRKPGKGLNLFILVLALSGLGKEAMHRIHYLMKVACENGDSTLAAARSLVKASKPVSEAALAKSLVKTPHFVSVQGEFCRVLREMSEAKTASPMFGLMTLMLNLYEKSGPGSVVGGREYSDATNNVQEIHGAAYSVLGEGTPESFYEALTEQMMENGFFQGGQFLSQSRSRSQRLTKVPLLNRLLNCWLRFAGCSMIP